MRRPVALAALLALAGCAAQQTAVPVDTLATPPDVGPGVDEEVGPLGVVSRRLAAGLGGLRGLGGRAEASEAEAPVLAWAHRPEGER